MGAVLLTGNGEGVYMLSCSPSHLNICDLIHGERVQGVLQEIWCVKNKIFYSGVCLRSKNRFLWVVVE